MTDWACRFLRPLGYGNGCSPQPDYKPEVPQPPTGEGVDAPIQPAEKQTGDMFKAIQQNGLGGNRTKKALDELGL